MRHRSLVLIAATLFVVSTISTALAAQEERQPAEPAVSPDRGTSNPVPLINQPLVPDAAKLAADLSTLSTPVPITSRPTLVDDVVSEIENWAKWFNILSIHNPAPEISLQFALKGSETRDPMARLGRPDMGALEGESVNAILEDNSDRDLYVTMLDLSSDGSISIVHPEEQGAREVLKPGSTLPKTFTTFLPKGRSRVTDVLKVFASFKPIDLSSLEHTQIRGIREGVTDDPLQELLEDSVAGLEV